ncbi:MAG: hypothetical protein ABI432_13445 [Flavobacteriales bacterium]
MKMLIAAMNGELKPSAKTENICRISLMVSVLTFITLIATTFMAS